MGVDGLTSKPLEPEEKQAPPPAVCVAPTRHTSSGSKEGSRKPSDAVKPPKPPSSVGSRFTGDSLADLEAKIRHRNERFRRENEALRHENARLKKLRECNDEAVKLGQQNDRLRKELRQQLSGSKRTRSRS